jgi:glycosyltransferase involved in cell wall biosynthesis
LKWPELADCKNACGNKIIEMSSAETSDVWVVVPAFNECTAIGATLKELTRLPYHIVVVDDGSSDDTARQALAFPITLLRHVCNLGQGAALQTGISYALGFPTVKYIVTFDSDGQHVPEDISRLLEPLRAGTCDVTLGSRFLEKGSTINIQRRKRLMLWMAVAFTKMTTGLLLTDTHNGLRAFTAQAAQRLQITQNRMAHASEILAQITHCGARYCEVPVRVLYTAYSVSKGQSIFNSINIIYDLVRGRMR